MNDKPLIDVRGIFRYYRDQCVVDDISFTLNRGEVLGFLGPNGAGKSTLMQIISGVLAASAGSVAISGHDIVDQALLAKQQLGYLPEQPPLYTDCTVDEYLFYCGRLRGIEKSALGAAVDDGKRSCGLSEVGKRLIGNLSKGYQQRTGIAQAIIHKPAAVILDEPGSGLDPNQNAEMRKLIREMRRDHGVILSTHMLGEIQSTCDRIIIINHGRIVLDKELGALSGSLEDIYLKLTQGKNTDVRLSP